MTVERTSPLHIFLIFLRLGLTSFGGPVAHLGYFREAFVQRRQWLSDTQYADLVALCQVLPGPASSQVGMALGLNRGGYPGLLAAWLGFTLPSALALMLAAVGLARLESDLIAGAVGGLKLVAVVIVAQAVIGMCRNLIRTRRQWLVMSASLLLMLSLSGVWSQLLVILLGALVGAVGRGRGAAPSGDGSRASMLPGAGVTARQGRFWLLLFGAGLVLLPWLAQTEASGLAVLIDGLYRSGALVFGGGHVVLPLLQNEVVLQGLVDESRFLAGYGLAQAVPGPLFTLASYLGSASAVGSASVAVSLLVGLAATLAIFLPAFLLLVGVLPFWERLRAHPLIYAALGGINAAVVGLLAAALWNPVITSAVHGPADLLLVALLAGLMRLKLPVVALVLCGAGGGVLLSLFG